MKEYKISRPQIRKCKLYNVMLMFFKPNIFWDWLDFGLVLKIYKQNNIGRYHFAIDIQIAWFNLWLQCWKKNKKKTNKTKCTKCKSKSVVKYRDGKQCSFCLHIV